MLLRGQTILFWSFQFFSCATFCRKINKPLNHQKIVDWNVCNDEISETVDMPQETSFFNKLFIIMNMSLLLYEGFCIFSGVGRFVHSRRRPHWSLLFDDGSGCWGSYVRCPDLQPSPCHVPQPNCWWQVGHPDSPWNNPRKSHCQYSRLVLGLNRIEIFSLSQLQCIYFFS